MTSHGIVIAPGFATAPILAAFASLSFVSTIPLAALVAEPRDLFVLCSLVGAPATAAGTAKYALSLSLQQRA